MSLQNYNMYFYTTSMLRSFHINFNKTETFTIKIIIKYVKTVCFIPTCNYRFYILYNNFNCKCFWFRKNVMYNSMLSLYGFSLGFIQLLYFDLIIVMCTFEHPWMGRLLYRCNKQLGLFIMIVIIVWICFHKSIRYSIGFL